MFSELPVTGFPVGCSETLSIAVLADLRHWEFQRAIGNSNEPLGIPMSHWEFQWAIGGEIPISHDAWESGPLWTRTRARARTPRLTGNIDHDTESSQEEGNVGKLDRENGTGQLSEKPGTFTDYPRMKGE